MVPSVVLITGGSGFFGQHLFRVLQERAENIQEIRILDVKPFENKFGVPIRIPTKYLKGDIKEVNEIHEEAFRGVDSVFHCAAEVSYQYPPDKSQLNLVNITGTKNVVQLCIDHNVKHLVYTSTAEVCMKPYFHNAFFGLIVNQTESKSQPPEDETQFIFNHYAYTKLEGEQIVSSANGHKNGLGCLRTVALRPTFLYGEHDAGWIPSLITLAQQLNGTIPRLGGPGGKHQFCYAGNAAWAHLCALKTLQEQPESIAGLPVFITDDTFIYDGARFCQKLTTFNESKTPLVTVSWWYFPALISFILTLIFEIVVGRLSKFIPFPKIPVSLKTLVVFLGSVILFSRLRATIHLKYSPIYEGLDCLSRSQKYYTNKFKRPIEKINHID